MGNNKYTPEGLKLFKKRQDNEPRRKLDASLVLKHRLTLTQQMFLEEWFNNGHEQILAYKDSTPKEKWETKKPEVIRSRAHQLMKSTKIQNYIADFQLKSALRPGTNDPIITVTEVIQSLADIIKGEDSKDSDKIKASEIVLKHLNAFSDHNSSRSPKILAYINNQSTDDLINEIHLLQEELVRDGKMLTSSISQTIEEPQTIDQTIDHTQNNYADYEDLNDDET